jgi:hypothetical protein
LSVPDWACVPVLLREGLAIVSFPVAACPRIATSDVVSACGILATGIALKPKNVRNGTSRRTVILDTSRSDRDHDSEIMPPIVVGLNAVIIAITEEQPRVLTVFLPEDAPIEGGGRPGDSRGESLLEALPTGPLDPAGDPTLELALRRWVRTYSDIELGYVEQLYTFGDRFRDPRELEGGPRVVSAAYLALVRESRLAGDLPARWRTVYRFFPWEDWRAGRPRVIDEHIAPALRAWIDAADGPDDRAVRRERCGIAFGLDGGHWDGERVLDRYELLYETALVEEARRDSRLRHGRVEEGLDLVPGAAMAFDHRRILATALGRIRGKIKYRPVIFELLPETFTLLELLRGVESLAGVRLHKQNFRRLVEQGGLVEGTGWIRSDTGGRPAELFRFRREVLLERPAPGVGLPGAKRS